ncbi:MAG: RecQ family ATP-dependent DNA helicase [Bacteroidales bacterium]
MELYKQILLKYWGHSEFRPLQEDIIRSVVEDRKDTLALMPTGGGKSITFQVPSLAQEGICLVITPLIALMKDQVEKLRKMGIKAMAIHSGMKKQEIDVSLDNCIFGDYKFLYVSPERLETAIFKTRVQNMKVNLVTVDEAHCISQWGYDFRPSYLKIVQLREYLSTPPPFLALTATATSRVIDDIQEKLGFKTRNVLWKSFERKNLVYLVRDVENKQQYLLKTLSKLRSSGIIYTRSRKKTRDIAELLYKNHISADYYHAGLEHEERARKQEDWQEGKKRIMVATNAFGMGIDKADVRFVIHYDVPDNIESYFQEAGRAGRDGKKAYAVLLYNNTDKVKSEQRIKNNFPDIKQIKSVYEALGNYFQIPIEGGKNQAFDFNISDFASTYHFSFLTIYNSLDFLQKEGYVELTDELSNRSKIHFWVNRDDLYNFQLSQAQYDTFIKLLLRSFTGVFTDYVNIDEGYLARRANTRVDVIYRYLQQLKKFRILDYIPYKKSPMIIFTEERLDKKNLHVSREKYRERKELYIQKLNHMIRYATNASKCRSRFLLEYFGEMNADRCGQCDVCTKRNDLQLSNWEFDTIYGEIQHHLREEALTSEQLIDRINRSEDKIIKMIDWLLDNNKLIATKNGELRWSEKRNQAGKS